MFDKIKYRVWHIPQVPTPIFRVDVSSVEEAKFVINVLADYDLFQWRCDIKPDYSNASGLEYWNKEDECWEEWQDDDGNTIKDLMNVE